MKRIFLSFIFCQLLSFSIYSQLDCSKDSLRYIKAYNIIKSDSVLNNKSLVVSDSIVDPDWCWFSKDMVMYPEEQKIVADYRENKKYIWKSPVYSHCLASIFPRINNNSMFALFFSLIEDNMLRADLFPHNERIIKLKYDEIAFQTEGYAYLFLFDKEDEVKSVFRLKIIYD